MSGSRSARRCAGARLGGPLVEPGDGGADRLLPSERDGLEQGDRAGRRRRLLRRGDDGNRGEDRERDQETTT